MLLIITIAVLLFAGIGESRPVDENSNENDLFYKNSKTHFPALDNHKDFQLPPIDNSDKITFTNDGLGNYYSSFKSRSFDRAEQGFLKNFGTDDEVQVILGQYTERFTDERGVRRSRTIGYIADENGFQPFLIDVTMDGKPENDSTTQRPQRPLRRPTLAPPRPPPPTPAPVTPPPPPVRPTSPPYRPTSSPGAPTGGIVSPPGAPTGAGIGSQCFEAACQIG